jgi:carboxymethylenebutenolidase
MSEQHWVQVHGKDGAFGAYIARPQGKPLGGIVVIQEIFGVNGFVRAVCDRYAAAGFVAVGPDLFWRIEPGVQLTDQSEAEWAKAFDLYKKFDVDKGVEDIQATIGWTRSHEGVGKVGGVGYCLGGLLAYLTATRTDADAAVGYYGVGIEGRLEEAEKLTRPLMLHIAEKDQFVPPAAQAEIRAGLGHNPHVTVHGYAEQDHAFSRYGGAHYDAKAADLANTRSLAFFFKTLAMG